MSVTEIDQSQFDTWRGWLREGAEAVPQDAGDLQPGKYKTKMGDRWVAVAIWYDAERALQFVRDGYKIANYSKQLEIFSYCRPVDDAEYDRIVAGPNGDPIYERIPDNYLALLAHVKALASKPCKIANGKDAERVADLAHALKAVEKKAKTKLDEETARAKEEIAQAKARWSETETIAKTARAVVMGSLQRHLEAKNEPGGAKSQLGRAISLRSYQTIEITDYAAALAHFVEQDPEAFSSVVEKLARAAVKAGVDAPGVKEVTERRAQ